MFITHLRKLEKQLFCQNVTFRNKGNYELFEFKWHNLRSNFDAFQSVLSNLNYEYLDRVDKCVYNVENCFREGSNC